MPRQAHFVGGNRRYSLLECLRCTLRKERTKVVMDTVGQEAS